MRLTLPALPRGLIGRYHRSPPPKSARHHGRRAATHGPAILRSYHPGSKDDDDESEAFADGSDLRRASSSGLASPELPREDDDSGVFSDGGRISVSELWDHVRMLRGQRDAINSRTAAAAATGDDESSGVFSERTVGTTRSEGSTSTVLWDYVRSPPGASRGENRRLQRSALHVARRCARFVAGMLLLAALLLYVALEMGLEPTSRRAHRASAPVDENLLVRLLRPNFMPERHELSSHGENKAKIAPRSRLHKLTEGAPPKRATAVPRERQRIPPQKGRARPNFMTERHELSSHGENKMKIAPNSRPHKLTEGVPSKQAAAVPRERQRIPSQKGRARSGKGMPPSGSQMKRAISPPKRARD